MIGCDPGNAKWSSSRGWESAKKRLGFGKVTQDGDCEGSIILDRLPSKAEAAEIRDIFGIPKRIELSEGQLASLRKHAAANAFKPVLPASGDEQATMGSGTRIGAFLMDDDGEDFDDGGGDTGSYEPAEDYSSRAVTQRPKCRKEENS